MSDGFSSSSSSVLGYSYYCFHRYYYCPSASVL